MSLNNEIVSNSEILESILTVELKSLKKISSETKVWQHIATHGDCVASRRPYVENDSGLYAYAIIGTIDLTNEQMVAVIQDLEYRNSWDEYSKNLQVIAKDDRNIHTEIVYWRVGYPWPVSHRDYLYRRVTQEVTLGDISENFPESELRTELLELLKSKYGEQAGDRKWTVIASRPIENAELDPIKPSTKSPPVRVKQFHSINVITQSSSSDSKCTFYTYLFDNPEGSIPKSVINFLANKAMPKSITASEKAGKAYESWRSKNGK